MKEWLKRYFLFPFYGFLVFIVVIVVLTIASKAIKGVKYPINVEFIITILGCVGCALIVSLIIGAFGYFMETKIGPNRRQKLLLMSPFTDLFLNGFILKDEAAVGITRGYTIIVGYEWNSGAGESIHIKVLFDPVFKDKTVTSAEHEKHYNTQIYNTKKNTTWIRQTLFWGQCFMLREMKLGFKLPKYEKVNEKINFIIDILQKGDLKPVGLEFYEKIFPIHLYA